MKSRNSDSSVTKNGSLLNVATKRLSPIGSPVAEGIRLAEAEDAEYRKARAHFSRAEAVARLLIQLRMRHGLTQEQLAGLMGTSVPAISRLESGTHVPSLTTLSRLAEAAGERLVIGFETVGALAGKDVRTLVRV